MKLLIGGSSSKFFHLKEFSETLEEYEVETKLVTDTEYADGFPSRKIDQWFKTNAKFKKLIGDFRAPNLMRFGICPLFINEEDILQSVKIINKVLDERLWESYKNISRATVT